VRASSRADDFRKKLLCELMPHGELHSATLPVGRSVRPTRRRPSRVNCLRAAVTAGGGTLNSSARRALIGACSSDDLPDRLQSSRDTRFFARHNFPLGVRYTDWCDSTLSRKRRAVFDSCSIWSRPPGIRQFEPVRVADVPNSQSAA
jgi:hypothetical protein